MPRTRAQAEIVDEMLARRRSAVRTALYLDVPTPVLVERIAGRWLCPSCQATYPGRSSDPPGNGTCVECRDRLYQRPDDRPEVVRHRIEVYLSSTVPVIDHYAKRGLLVKIDGNRSVSTVRMALVISIGGVVRGRRRARWHLFVSHDFSAVRGTSAWHGRTLCGHLVNSRTDPQVGAEEDFRSHPCHECHVAIRARPGGISHAGPRTR
jgi:hypothetical protein